MEQMIICKVCGRGELKRKKIFRFNLPVVLIGFFVLIPGLIGMWVGLSMFTSMPADPAMLVSTMLLGFVITCVSFIGSLLGWFLTMRRAVLRCSICSAIINAC